MPSLAAHHTFTTVSFKVELPRLPSAGQRATVDVGSFSEVSGLSAEVEFMTYNEGGNNEFVHHLPTRVKYPNLVLKRGVTNEDALLAWFKEAHGDKKRYDITVTMLDRTNKPLRTWAFEKAFPVKWTGPSFNATQSQVAMETLEIVHEGLKPY